MEYDRLNYTPPANKWKQHYQRMNNSIGTIPNGQPTPPVREDSPTPPIPPLPKLNFVPLPPKRDEESLDVPIPPKREDPPGSITDTSEVENINP